jgi:hypothetical protein
MLVSCPRCRRPVPGSDVDLTTHTAFCRGCHEVLPVPGEVFEADPIQARAPLQALPDVDASFVSPRLDPQELANVVRPKPADMLWEEATAAPGAVCVVSRPPRGPAMVILVIALFLDVSVVILRHFAGGTAHGLLLMWGFGGLLMSYAALAGLVNRSFVSIDRSRFVFERGPIPERVRFWRTDVVDEVALDLEDFTAAAVRGHWHIGEGRGWPAWWGVQVTTRDGRMLTLAFGFLSQGHAEYAAFRLRKMLADLQPRTLPYRG